VAAGRSGVPDDERLDGFGRSTISDDPGAPRSADGQADERAIVAAVLAGDRDAFRRLVERASVGATARTDPAALSMRSEQAMEVRRAVTMLPEPYREVVALRFFGDATLDEIARQTGRPLGTVKTHLHRGLARLRTQLDRTEP
jgi:RNA polymerase sigma-70 factor (ECF subfamily)